MVSSTQGRADTEEVLTKTVTYYKYNITNKDLAYSVQTRGTPTSYKIKVQCTIQNLDSKYVEEGILQAGDLVGLFRYEYTKSADGNLLVPTLIPKKGDEILFLGKRYAIKACTPQTSEDDGIIGWDFTGGATNVP